MRKQHQAIYALESPSTESTIQQESVMHLTLLEVGDGAENDFCVEVVRQRGDELRLDGHLWVEETDSAISRVRANTRHFYKRKKRTINNRFDQQHDG